MTSQNHSAFLICPTSRTTHLGGTPLESGEARGHIRKTWVHVADAALRGLPADIAGDQAMHLVVQKALNAHERHGNAEKEADEGKQCAAVDERKAAHARQAGVCQKCARPKDLSHGSGPLLLCGAALKLVKPKDAVKTAWVGFELPLAEFFDLKLASVRDDPGPDPVADGALIAAQRTSRQLLIAVKAGNLFRGHGEIMALAIWLLP